MQIITIVTQVKEGGQVEVLGWSQAALKDRLLTTLELLQVLQGMGTGVVEALRAAPAPPIPVTPGAALPPELGVRPQRRWTMRAHADVVKAGEQKSGDGAEEPKPPQEGGAQE